MTFKQRFLFGKVILFLGNLILFNSIFSVPKEEDNPQSMKMALSIDTSMIAVISSNESLYVIDNKGKTYLITKLI